MSGSISIARDLSQLETVDRHGDAVPEAQVERLKGKIDKLKEEVVRLNEINVEMMKSEDKQISLVDPDPRSMATGGEDTGIVGHNVQVAVDTQHHLIVAHDVTNVGTDSHQLANMADRRVQRWRSRRSASLLTAATMTAKSFLRVRRPASQ